MARVLIVDDSPITRAMIADFLQMSGHQVAAEAENMTQALAAYIAKKPDLVTLDLALGQDDGFVVLKGLRELDPKVRVLVVSANTQQDIFDQLIELGAKGCMSKPFTLEDLASAVKKSLAA